MISGLVWVTTEYGTGDGTSLWEQVMKDFVTSASLCIITSKQSYFHVIRTLPEPYGKVCIGKN